MCTNKCSCFNCQEETNESNYDYEATIETRTDNTADEYRC